MVTGYMHTGIILFEKGFGANICLPFLEGEIDVKS